MARRELPTSAIAEAIKDGRHDSELEAISSAIQWRKKVMFRKGVKVRLVGLSRSPHLEGRIGTVEKVNVKRITVGLGEKDEHGFYPEGELLVPVGMLEIVRNEK